MKAKISAVTISIIVVFSFIIQFTCYSQQVETLTASFNAAGGVNVDNNGFVYVADFGNFLNAGTGTNVYKVLEDGSVTVFATGLVGASGNDFGPDGFLYQSNIGASRISKIATDGTVTTLANGVTAPVGCIVTKDTIVFATNCTQNPGEIDMITPDGTVTTFVSSNLLSCPNGLTMDSLGNLYTCNFNNGWVLKITPNKVVSNFAFIPGNNNGHLTYANGRLYVVARCANQIYTVEMDGTVSLLAGSGARGNDDGPALSATFSIPNGIAASVTGDTLYINDAVPTTGGCFSGSLNPVVVRMIIGLVTDVEDETSEVPSEFRLEQNYPNPFNPITKFSYSLPQSSTVNIVIYNMLGQQVRTLVDINNQSAGTYEVHWNGQDNFGKQVASGTYIYRMKADNFVQSSKLTLLR